MNWEVRQYQQEAVAACLAGFAERGCTSVMLESPVGSGKTYMALEVIHALQERLGRRFKVNWVAPRHHLLQQVMEANRDLHRDVECYLHSRQEWGKTLAFFPTVLECHQFRQILADAGVACEVVTAESDKDRQLEDFISGRVRVVANVSMLTEGFDQPDVQTIFARDASRLPTIQMCGRGLRLTEGKDHCNIVQSAKTSYLFERVTPARRRFRLMNGQWLALQDGTAAIEATLQQSLLLLEQREKEYAERKKKRGGGLRLDGRAVNGRVYRGISLTLAICAGAQTGSFMPILLFSPEF